MAPQTAQLEEQQLIRVHIYTYNTCRHVHVCRVHKLKLLLCAAIHFRCCPVPSCFEAAKDSATRRKKLVCRFTSIYQGTVLLGSQPRHSRTLTVMRGRSKSFMSLGWNRTLCRFDCPDPNSSRERAFVYNIWQCRERLEH